MVVQYPSGQGTVGDRMKQQPEDRLWLFGDEFTPQEWMAAHVSRVSRALSVTWAYKTSLAKVVFK